MIVQDSLNEQPLRENREVDDPNSNLKSKPVGKDNAKTSSAREIISEWDLIKQYLKNKNLSLENVRGDGHCLLYAVQAGMRRNNNESIFTEEICDKLTQEVTDNSQLCNKFAVVGQNIETDRQNYIKKDNTATTLEI